MTTSRLVVVLGARPGRTADDVLADVAHGAEVQVLVPALEPNVEQHGFVERAMTLAWEHGFVLTAELVVDGRAIAASLNGHEVRALADRRERRRLGLPSPGSPS